MSFREELKALDCGEVFDDPKTLASASHDTSLFEVRPQLVVLPRNEKDLEKLVTFATQNKGMMTLTARSGGTGMDGGALSESVVLDFTKHFAGTKGFTKDTGTVLPGTYYRDFERESMKRNLLMPSYPASREICTVGGMVANNAGGELTLTYGKTADYVRELRVVLSDGLTHIIKPLTTSQLQEKLLETTFEGNLYRQIYKLIIENKVVIEKSKPRVTKNSAGYALWDIHNERDGIFDLTRLFTGSQGTLGLITEITFGLMHPPSRSQMLVVFLDDLSQLPAIVKTTLATSPTTFESYDDKTLALALRFFFEFIRRLGVRKTLSIAFGNLSAGWSLMRKGLPKLVLQITWNGEDVHALKQKAEELKHALTPFSPRLSH
ncbi:MAG: FAD-binding oxidoreductase, partial [Candidatus Pacebacteria bacterium]|nr:FAD-binding oxidoreductase [Candidatus Paceibacterota bacterium]